ncbi:MAG: bifunctional UDP-3-O-[3-hydroxymyristoyl] N-acetylglucosamine deacetylase/3-hydroxyacyl-ACP dehydratase [Flavobacteriales bacterium]
MEYQRTLKAPITVSGVGLHTGAKVELTIQPAAENHGYKFQRLDIEGQPIVKADASLVVSTERGTTLDDKGVKIHTTEHVLAALYGMQVDNALIQITGPEVPIMDGSAWPFVEAIDKVGYQEQKAEREYFELTHNIPWYDPDKNIEILAVPSKDFRLTVMVDYNSPVLGTQHATMYNISEFKKEISPCRTFVFLGELEQLAKKGLIKGGDPDNAIVLVEREQINEKELKDLAKLLGKEDLEVKIKGIGVLNNVQLKHYNEPARHKLLDIVGDLALVGRPIKAHILAARPGHSGNVSFARALKDIIQQETKNPTKFFDLTKQPVFDINQIEKMLPHRYPFLLVDKVIGLTPEGIVGVKNVTMNEPFFQGHFPGNPIMPGVLQIEAMAQCGGIFALNSVPDPENYTTYFMKIDKVRYRKKVIPGDTVIFDLKLLTPIRRGIVHMSGIAYVNGQPVMEAEMMAQVVKDKNV